MLQVCLLKRHHDSSFLGGAYVFPGGKVDESDRSEEAAALCSGVDDGRASELLDVPSGGLAFFVAAVRECFEEAGVLFARKDDAAILSGGRHAGAGAPGATGALAGAAGASLVPGHDPEGGLAGLREQVLAKGVGFIEAMEAAGLVLAADHLHYFSHWITPEVVPQRYDTRFFVGVLPPGQVPIHDDHEVVETIWITPAEALDRSRSGELELIFPTFRNIEAIGRFDQVEQLVDAARSARHIPAMLPVVVVDEDGVRIEIPGEGEGERSSGSGGPASPSAPGGRATAP
jgi:8-oxo-dGTP pyrophosphatase MutT (NUDIX family)